MPFVGGGSSHLGCDGKPTVTPPGPLHPYLVEAGLGTAIPGVRGALRVPSPSPPLPFADFLQDVQWISGVSPDGGVSQTQNVSYQA